MVTGAGRRCGAAGTGDQDSQARPSSRPQNARYCWSAVRRSSVVVSFSQDARSVVCSRCSEATNAFATSSAAAAAAPRPPWDHQRTSPGSPATAARPERRRGCPRRSGPAASLAEAAGAAGVHGAGGHGACARVARAHGGCAHGCVRPGARGARGRYRGHRRRGLRDGRSALDAVAPLAAAGSSRAEPRGTARGGGSCSSPAPSISGAACRPTSSSLAGSSPTTSSPAGRSLASSSAAGRSVASSSVTGRSVTGSSPGRSADRRAVIGRRRREPRRHPPRGHRLGVRPGSRRGARRRWGRPSSRRLPCGPPSRRAEKSCASPFLPARAGHGVGCAIEDRVGGLVHGGGGLTGRVAGSGGLVHASGRRLVRGE